MRWFVLLFLFTVCFARPSHSAIIGMGDLSGGQFQSVPDAVSDNGTVAVGYSSSSNGLEAFRWKQGNSIVGLGDLPGSSSNSFARNVSGDGSVVVGLEWVNS